MAAVCVAILNWNGSALTLKWVRHVNAQSYPNYKTLVVDNGSIAEECNILHAQCDFAFELIKLPRNLGFAGGMNVAITEANRWGYDYIWMMNNDAFPAPDALEKLVTVMEEEKHLGAVTPALYSEDGSEQWAGVRVNWEAGENENLKATDMADHASEDCLVMGTAPLVRTSALRRVGMFDPRFFAYQEEIDLFLRMQKEGYLFRGVPEARCVHLNSASSGGVQSPLRRYLNTRNGLLLLRKHLTGGRYRASMLNYFITCLERAGAMRAYGNPVSAQAITRGLLAALVHETGHPRSLKGFSPLSRFLAEHPWRLAWFLKRLRVFISRSSNK